MLGGGQGKQGGAGAGLMGRWYPAEWQYSLILLTICEAKHICGFYFNFIDYILCWIWSVEAWTPLPKKWHLRSTSSSGPPFSF